MLKEKLNEKLWASYDRAQKKADKKAAKDREWAEREERYRTGKMGIGEQIAFKREKAERQRKKDRKDMLLSFLLVFLMSAGIVGGVVGIFCSPTLLAFSLVVLAGSAAFDPNILWVFIG